MQFLQWLGLHEVPQLQRNRADPLTRPPPETPLVTTNTMKSTIPTIIILAAILTGCGESRKERIQREEAERDRRTLLEYQRQENIQRQAERDQRAVESGVQVLDILTR